MGARLRVAVGVVLAVLLSMVAAWSSGTTAIAGGRAQAVKIATFAFSGVGAPAGSSAQIGPAHQPMNKTLRHTAASQVPRVAGASVLSSTGGASGFNGIDDAQQATAGTGAWAGTQSDVSPPDQGLCVGQGDVLEVVNTAVRVYSETGAPLTPTVPLNQFAGLPPEASPGPGGTFTFGPSVFDPRCYYDPDSARWFLSFGETAVDPTTGALGSTSAQYIAVSQTADPAGAWSIYEFPTTNDGSAGTPSDPGCPCFGDQPLLGADANGIYIASNEYSITGPAYNGAQVYALSKSGLESGTNTAVTELQPGLDPTVTSALGGVAFSLQPATSPAAGYESSAGGTEYLQSALDFGAAPSLGTRADRIAVWSLTDTSSLDTASPSLALHVTVVPSEEYTQPPNAAQAPGTLVTNKHLPLLDANDDRMNQVVYADGHLWSALNTAVKTPQGPTLAGIAWFATTPSTATSGTLSASLAGQGYLAVNKEDVIFPSIGVTAAGKAVMAFTLAGPDYHPSAAWAPLSLSAGAGPIYIAAAGVGAGDDFTALKAYGGSGSIRWGDYTAAVSDAAGNVWMGAEYISGVERTPFADWATRISEVTP